MPRGLLCLDSWYLVKLPDIWWCSCRGCRFFFDHSKGVLLFLWRSQHRPPSTSFVCARLLSLRACVGRVSSHPSYRCTRCYVNVVCLVTVCTLQWVEDQFPTGRCTHGHWLPCLMAAIVQSKCRYWKMSQLWHSAMHSQHKKYTRRYEKAMQIEKI